MKCKRGFFVIALLAIMALSAYSQQEYDDEDDFEFELHTSATGYYGIDGRYIIIVDYIGEKQDVAIPPRIRGVPVTEIGEGAFAFRGLTSVTIPDTVMRIGASAFEVNQLTTVTIPPNVTIIEDGTFANNQLTEVIIPENVTFIGSSAFAGNRLTSVVIPDKVIFIGEFAFSVNPLERITIPRRVTLERDAFGIKFMIFYEYRGRRAGSYALIRGEWSARIRYQ